MPLNLENKKHFSTPFDILKTLTTVHGVNHLTNTSGRRLLGWSLVIAGNIFFTIYLIMVIKNRYESNQIYTRIDATCRVNQVPFPAVSICNSNLISIRQTKNIQSILTFYDRKEDEIVAFFDSLQELAHFGFESANVSNFTEIMDILKRHYFTVDSIMEELHQTCERLLLYCEFNRKTKRCRDVFKMIKTLEGHCCAFNYAALNDATDEPVWEDETDLEYYDDRKIGAIISTSKSGRASGLTALVNIEPEDYPPWSNSIIYGAKVIISDPNDFPETTVVFRHVTAGESIDIKVQPMVFLSDESIRRIAVPVRDCWFHDEVLLGHTDRYSFETCKTECEMRAYNQQCQCIPYRYPKGDPDSCRFMPRIRPISKANNSDGPNKLPLSKDANKYKDKRSAKICELSDVPCLHNMTVHGKVPCECYLECADKKYGVRSNIMPFSDQDFSSNLTKNLDFNTAISIKVYFGESTCSCYKKTLVMDFDRIIGTYGGVVSLSIGGSILTMFEVSYLAISYLFAFIIRIISKRK